MVLTEAHPAAALALEYLRGLGRERLTEHHDRLSRFDVTTRRDRNDQVCRETLRRLLAGEGASDRDLLGLAWTLRELEAR